MTINKAERPYPDGAAFDEAWRQRQRADAMEESRDSWRTACRHLFVVMSESGKRGKPMDLIGRADHNRIVAMIAKSEFRDPESS